MLTSGPERRVSFTGSAHNTPGSTELSLGFGFQRQWRAADRRVATEESAMKDFQNQLLMEQVSASG